MSSSRKNFWFPVMAAAIFSVFLTILVMVTLIAHTKRSGRTGMDMATMHLMRSQGAEKTIEQ